ncbi:MAG: energy transducer TonB [Vicinamibacterales bacterium]
MITLSLVLVLLTATEIVPVAAAQNALEEAKAQYAAAAYEEALSTLTRASNVPAGNRAEVEQYRAFCLIALGRMDDAERAVAALVEADPKYAPSPSIASPRVLLLVAEFRKKELPALARRLLDAGRKAFQAKDFAGAQENLNLLLQILDDDAMKGRPGSEDLRVLAEGFVTLASAKATAPAAPAVPSAPAPAPPPASDAPVVQADTVTEPVPLVQEAPTWVPPNAIAGSREYTGAIRIRIGADGQVMSATIEKATYPSYDARLLQASRQWTYKPATRNGEPVESERVIPIQLRPRQ